MGFKNDIPEYKSIPDDSLYMHTVPSELWHSLESLIRRSANSANTLKAVINRIAEITGGSITTNWGWSFLENDIQDCVSGIRKYVEGGRVEHFDSLMDSLAVLHKVGELTIDEINDYLENYGIGYRCYSLVGDLHWSIVEGTQGAVGNIVEVQAMIKPLSQQAFERFESALRQFKDINKDERARKDAVRSCVDAMEALIKELGRDNEIGEATKHLKDEIDSQGNNIWGPAELVKDGNNLFNQLHRLYPDVRHGTQDYDTTKMTIEEAEFFVDKITAFMKYIAARAKKLGRF